MRITNSNTNYSSAILPSIKNLFMSKLFGIGFAAAIVFAAFAPSSSAFATTFDAQTVPNRFECSTQTFFCVQINGAYDPSVPNACRWVSTYYGSGWTVGICHPDLWW